jgi:peptidoglycan/xylan/chitin deacetylase (PgdA/CDA1 family)
MIGVIADPAEADVVREFFELFKTPWEFYRSGQRYDVLLCAGDWPFEATPNLVVLYAGKKTRFDDSQNTQTTRSSGRAHVLAYEQGRIPVYGDIATFPEKGNALLTVEDSVECVAFLDESSDRLVVRIGYDLFSEVRTLLTVGQPPANAHMPALELHIAFLKDLITGCGVPLVEIPPVPDGYQFVACLTHDVDHPAIRPHKWDHTMFGFLYRATFDSLRKLFRGRLSVPDLFRNFAAALKLPLVHLGLARDFWREFDDLYLEMEKGLHSTFFVIPFSGQPGRKSDGAAPAMRAARYGAQDIADAIRKLTTAGCEVGLHGIDAWFDSAKGRQELQEILKITGGSKVGVRMHWLYFEQQSPFVLEQAGAAYDSTIGYNGTVGYHAGTTQVYKPLGATRLLELPLHVMDTALFYPSRLALSPRRAKALLGPMLENVVRFGGTFTVNWHDRSLAPERLWGEFYRELIQELQSRGAWFATVGQATSWFRNRRAAGFETHPMEPGTVRVKLAVDQCDKLPELRLRVHNPRNSSPAGMQRSADFVDMKIAQGVESHIPSEARR